MNRLWDSLIHPIIEEIEAKYIVEIGSESGINTKNILDYCEANDARMTAIDPFPGFDVDEFKNKYGDKFEFYQELSLSRLPLLKDYDVILIDGDHNWYTVYNELKIIEKTFKDKEFPLVFLHDVGWPYGRRDLYYNPENIPEAFRQPYKKAGMYPGESNLKDEKGINRHLYNSIYENNPQNGVLTAIEDFIDESDFEFTFKIIKAFFGLGILFPKDKKVENEVRNIIKSAELTNNLEKERIKLIITLNETKTRVKNKENQITQTEKKLETSKQQINQINTQLKQKETQITQTEKKLETSKQQINQINSQLKQKETQITQTEKKLETSKQQINQINSQLKQKETQINNAVYKLISLTKSIKERENFIFGIKKSDEEIFKELNTQLNNLKYNFIGIEYLTNKNRSIFQRLISKFPILYILFHMHKTGLKNSLRNLKGYRAIKKNKLLEIGFYLKNNDDVRFSGIDPILHYIYHGFKEGRKPSSSFDADYYLKVHEDVKNFKFNPLVHYALYGLNEGRTTQKIEINKIMVKKEETQLNQDYLTLSNSELFDVKWYMEKYSDIDFIKIDPIEHYLRFGIKEERNPGPYFDTKSYLDDNLDVTRDGMNPLIHYIRYGIAENRSLNQSFGSKESQLINSSAKIEKKKKICQNDNHESSKILNVHEITGKKENLNIGYVLWDFPTFSQTFVMNELRWLVENNYNVMVFYRGKPDKEAELDFNIRAVKIQNADHLVKKIKEFDINLLHTHFTYPTCTQLTWPAAEETGTPFTLFAHAVDIFHYENDRRNKIDEIGKSKYCKKIFVLGNFHYNYLAERGVPEGKLMLLRQATKYEIDSEINMDMPRFKRQIRDVITISRFIEKKGIDTLIDAAKILEKEDLNFKIYGYGPLEKDLQTQIDELNLKNVTIEGPLNGDAVKKAYLNGDMFVLPCRRASNGDMDGMPTVIFEAMAYGIPVITTNVSSIPEFVLDNYCGFIVSPNDPLALAKKIQYVKDMDKNKLFTILKNAQKSVQIYSSVKETIETMLDIWTNYQIDLFMVTYQKGKYKDIETVKEILDRIFKHTTTEFHLTIVDNGSDDDFKYFISNYANSHPNIQLISLPENLQCGPASNIALENMDGELAIYICSNEGFILKHGWERDAIKYMRNNKDIALAGTLAYSPSYYNGKTYKGQEFFKKFRNSEYIENHDNVKLRHVQGGAYILRKHIYDKYGGFNPLFPQSYMDVEYSYYLKSNGLKLGEIPNWISLTKITLPNIYTYLDEYTALVHPLNLKDLNTINDSALNHCNICNGKIINNFCSVCNSDDSERAIYRIVGKSDKPYRSLKCTLLLKHNTVYKIFGTKMFNLRNTAYSTKSLNNGLTEVLENLEDTNVLIINLDLEKLNFKKVLNVINEKLVDESFLILELSNNESLNEEIKEFLINKRFMIDTISFASNKLTNKEFLVAEKDDDGNCF